MSKLITQINQLVTDLKQLRHEVDTLRTKTQRVTDRIVKARRQLYLKRYAEIGETMNSLEYETWTDDLHIQFLFKGKATGWKVSIYWETSRDSPEIAVKRRGKFLTGMIYRHNSDVYCFQKDNFSVIKKALLFITHRANSEN